MSEPNITTILSDVKNYLDCTDANEIDPYFDAPIKDAINNAIAELAHQGGLLNVGDFAVVTGNETWDEYLGNDNSYLLSFVKTYIQISTKLEWDPPQSSSLCSSLEERQKKVLFNIQTTIELHNIENSEG